MFGRPLGLPLGLPETPLRNRDSSGGFENPTSYGESSLFLNIDHLLLPLREALPGAFICAFKAGKPLPSAHNRVDINGVQFQPIANSTRSLCRDDCGAAPQKWIEH